MIKYFYSAVYKSLYHVKTNFSLLLLSLFVMSSPTHALVVLQYHHVDAKGPLSTSVSPEQFIEHMALIESMGFEVVDLEKATRDILNKEVDSDITRKQVAISFDDAYHSIFEHAYPELKRRNWPFTIFVNTQAVNQQNVGIMSWDTLQQLVDNGVTIAGHSVTHAHLPLIPEGQTLNHWLDEEVLSSHKELQQRLGKIGNMFAYPYGEFTLEMAPWFEQKDMLAFGQHSGPIGKLSHPYALPRFPASGIYAKVETLKTKLLSIALPVPVDQVKNPTLSAQNNPPKLTINIVDSDYTASRLQCFASQQGPIKTTVESQTGQKSVELITQAPKSLTGERARYNCTVPSSQKERYYWYSQPWQMY